MGGSQVIVWIRSRIKPPGGLKILISVQRSYNEAILAATTKLLEAGVGAEQNLKPDEVDRLLRSYQPSRLPEPTKKDLVTLMEKEARRYGQDRLPERK